MAEEDKCPGCGLDLSRVLFGGTSSAFHCPSCGADVSSHVTVLVLGSDMEEPAGSPRDDGPDQRFVRYQHKQLGFSLEHPAGWRTEFAGNALLVHPTDARKVPGPGGEEPKLSPCMTLLVGQVSPASPDDLLDGFVSAQPSNLVEYRLLSRRPFELSSGDAALEWAFDFKVGSSPFTAVSVIAVRRDKVFVLDASCLKQDFQPIERVLTRAVTSLSLQ